MQLVKGFKIQLTTHSGKVHVRAWNEHAQFELEDFNIKATIRDAVLGCLKYHVARYFESAYIQEISTGEVVYQNLAFAEFVDRVTDVDWTKRSTLVQVDGKLAYLDCEYELCHGFRVVRIGAVRFLSTIHQQS